MGCERAVAPAVSSAPRLRDEGRKRRGAEDAARPGRKSSRGKAARREAASLLSIADRRVSKLRSRLCAAMPQTCRAGRSARRTSTSLPRNRRKRRSTSTASRVSRDRSDQLQGRRTGVLRAKDQRQTSTAGLDRGTKDRGQLRRFGPRWLRRTNVKLRIASILVGTKPVQQGSRTQISKVGTWKNQQHNQYYRTSVRDGRALRRHRPNRFNPVHENFN